MSKPSIFSAEGNEYIAAFNQRSQPTTVLMTPVEQRRKNRGGLVGGVGYAVGSAAAGLAGVFEGIGDLVTGTAALFSGDKAYAEHVYSDDVVGGWKRNMDLAYNPGSVMRFVGDAAMGVGQSSVFLVPQVGAGLFFAGVIGGSTGEAVKKTGKVGLREYIYGVASGATEGALEWVTGAGGQLARRIYGKAATKAGGAVLGAVGKKVSEWASASAARGVLKDMVSSAAGEFVEEFLGDYTDVLWSRVTGVDPEASTTLAQAMYSGLVGAASGAFMAGTASSINTGRLYSSGKRVMDNGNVDATIKTAETVANSFASETGKGVPPALSDLKQTLTAYNGLADKTGTNAAIMLGRLKADIFYTQSYIGVQQTALQVAAACSTSADAAAKYAAYMSYQTGKEYTAEDFINNKDEIRDLYAVEAWAMTFLGDSRAQADMAEMRAIIDADKAATAAGTPSEVRNISEAVRRNSGAGWDGSDAVYKVESDISGLKAQRDKELGITDSGETGEVDYIRVKKLGEDSYSVSWGATADLMRGFTSRTGEQVREILGKIAEADSALSASIETYKAADANPFGRTRDKYESAARAEKALGALGDTMDEATAAEPNRSGVTYTAAEQDAARDAVKGFDALHPDTRSAIMEWMRSVAGLDKKTQRAVAQIMAARPGLYVLNAELGEGHRGLHSDTLKSGKRLIVVDAKTAGDAALQTITHELVHDIESTRGYAKLKKAAVASTSEARRREITDMYVRQYGAESYTDWLGDRQGTPETWQEYLDAHPDVDGEAVTSEVVAKAVGEKLGDLGFIRKYGEKNILTRALGSLKRLYKALRADKATGAAIGTTAKLGRMFEAALGQMGENAGQGATKYSFAGEKSKTADLTKLETAKRMLADGAEPDPVRKETGWFRGADGKWRYEIDNSNVKLRYEATLYDYVTELREKNRAWNKLTSRELSDKQIGDLANYMRGAEADLHDDALYAKLSEELGDDFDKWALTLETVKEAKKGMPDYITLGDLLDAPELFEAYPDMAELIVTFQALENGQKGGYSRKSDSIELSRDLKRSPELLLDTLIHEAQHAIQNREGFASGANPAYWNRRLENGYDGRTVAAKREMQGLKEQYDRIVKNDPQFASKMKALEAMTPTVPRGKVNWDTLEKIEPDPPEWVRFDKRRSELEKQYGADRVMSWISLQDKISRNARVGERGPARLYHDTAGEIEARDASSRRGLTAEERRSRKPDTGDEDTVFAYGDTVSYLFDENVRSTQSKAIISLIASNTSKISDDIVFDERSVDIRRYAKKSDYVLEVFNRQNNIAYNSTIGNVELVKSGAKSTMLHGFGKNKIAAIPAIKSVIENGNIISFAENYSNSYDRYVIAAKGKIDGKNAIVGVVVNSYRHNGQKKFYLHEVTIAKAESSSMTGSRKGEVTVNGSASANSISQTAANVNSVDKNKSTQKFDLTESRTDVTETANFKRWFGDWQAHPESASKVVNKDGTPKIVYHQTESDFTVFDTTREGSGARDNETPFGIFLKSSNSDIGLRGKKQMALYASIKNPLVVANRAELVQRLSALSSKYSELYERSKSIDKEYKAKVEKAVKAFNDFVIKNSQSENRKTRQELYEDSEFLKLFDAEDNLVDEWTREASKNDVLMKNEIVMVLKSKGYDGVVLREDSGSFGRSTDAYIALDASQVKSATNNVGTFDSANPDIRYDLDENATADNKKAEANNKKADSDNKKADADNKKKAEQKAAREKRQAEATRRSELENNAVRQRRKSFDYDYAEQVSSDVSKIYSLDAKMLPKLAAAVHEYFNMYDTDVAVGKAQKAIRQIYEDYRIAYEKKRAKADKPMPSLRSMEAFDRDTARVAEYLKKAYADGGNNARVNYSRKEVSDAIRQSVSDKTVSTPNGATVSDTISIDEKELRKITSRLTSSFASEQYSEAQLDTIASEIADRIIDSAIVQNDAAVDDIANRLDESAATYLSLQSYMHSISTDAELSVYLSSAKASSKIRAMLERWLSPKKRSKNQAEAMTATQVSEALAEKGIFVQAASDSSIDIIRAIDHALDVSSRAYDKVKKDVLTKKYGVDRGRIINTIKDLYRQSGDISRRDQLAAEYSKKLNAQRLAAEERIAKIRSQAKEKISVLKNQNSASRAINNIRRLGDTAKNRMVGYKRVGILADTRFETLLKSMPTIVRGNVLSAPRAVEFVNNTLGFLQYAAPATMQMVEYLDTHPDGEGPGSMVQKYLDEIRDPDSIATFFGDLIEPLTSIAELGKINTEIENAPLQIERALTLDELNTIAKAMQTIISLDARHGRVYVNGEWVDSTPYSDNLMTSTAEMWRGSKTNMQKFFTSAGILETVQPDVFAHIIEGTFGDKKGVLTVGVDEITKAANQKIYDMIGLMEPIDNFLNDGIKDGDKLLGGKEYKKHYERDKVKLTIRDPGKGTKTVYISVGEALSLTATWKRAQARPTLALNAFEFSDVKGRGEEFQGRVFERIAIDEGMDPSSSEFSAFMDQMMNQVGKSVAEVESQLTDSDKKFRELGEQFFAKSKELKMETDIILHGKSNIIAGYYFPILRSAFGRDMDYIGRGGFEYTPSTRGYAWNKRTLRQANGKIVIKDFYDVISNHADQLTSYKNYSIPLQNFQRIINSKTSFTAKDCRTAREYISRYVFDEFDNYISKYISDVQGRRRVGGEVDRKLERFLGHGVSYALGLNIQSAIKQFGSACLAQGFLPYSSWVKGFIPRNSDKMTKYSIAAKNRTYDSVFLSAASGLRLPLGAENIPGAAMITLKKGDEITTQMLWSMCQCEVERSQGLKIGSEENLIEAGKKLDWLISKCQDTSDDASKSALSRSDNRLWQMTTMFRNQQMKVWSNVVSCAWEAYNLKQIKKSGGTVSESQAKQARTRASKLAAGIVTGAAFSSAVAALLSSMRGNRDDDDEPIIKSMALDTLGDILGTVPLAGQLAQTLLTGYDAENFYYGVINDGLDAVKAIYSPINKWVTGKHVTTQDTANAIRKGMLLAGQLTGVPVRNFENIVKSATHTVSPTMYRKYKSLFYAPTASDVKKAIDSGNTRLAETEMRQLMLYAKTGSRSNAKVNSELTRLYGAGYKNVVPRAVPSNVTVDDESIELSRDQYKQFARIYQSADNYAAQLVTTAEYAELDDEYKSKAIKSVYDIYYSRAAHNVLGRTLTTAAALSYMCDDIPGLVTAAAHIAGLKTDEDGERADKVRQYVGGFPADMQPLLYYIAGMRSSGVKSSLSGLISGLPESERADVSKALKIGT